MKQSLKLTIGLYLRLIQKKGIKLRQQDRQEIENLFSYAKPVESKSSVHDTLVLLS